MDKKIWTFCIVFILGCCSLSAQKNEQSWERFYNYNWQPSTPANARFYSIVKKTDSGFYRLDYFLRERKSQMAGLFEDDSCKIGNGLFTYFYPSGKASKQGRYVHGKKEGLWIELFDDGSFKDSTVYKNDKPIGISLSFYENGFAKDSSVTDDIGNVTCVSWFENGNVSCTGRYMEWKVPVSTWLFYHENGQLASREKYSKGNLIDKHYFDEQGNEMDTTNRDRDPQFPGDSLAWKKYLHKALYFPSQYKIVNSDSAVVGIEWTVGTDGNSKNISVYVPFVDVLDRIVINAIKNCKIKWLPAISHNRFVPFTERQIVYFKQN